MLRIFPLPFIISVAALASEASDRGSPQEAGKKAATQARREHKTEKEVAFAVKKAATAQGVANTKEAVKKARARGSSAKEVIRVAAAAASSAEKDVVEAVNVAAGPCTGTPIQMATERSFKVASTGRWKDQNLKYKYGNYDTYSEWAWQYAKKDPPAYVPPPCPKTRLLSPKSAERILGQGAKAQEVDLEQFATKTWINKKIAKEGYNIAADIAKAAIKAGISDVPSRALVVKLVRYDPRVVHMTRLQKNQIRKLAWTLAKTGIEKKQDALMDIDEAGAAKRRTPSGGASKVSPAVHVDEVAVQIVMAAKKTTNTTRRAAKALALKLLKFDQRVTTMTPAAANATMQEVLHSLKSHAAARKAVSKAIAAVKAKGGSYLDTFKAAFRAALQASRTAKKGSLMPAKPAKTVRQIAEKLFAQVEIARAKEINSSRKKLKTEGHQEYTNKTAISVKMEMKMKRLASEHLVKVKQTVKNESTGKMLTVARKVKAEITSKSLKVNRSYKALEEARGKQRKVKKEADESKAKANQSKVKAQVIDAIKKNISKTRALKKKHDAHLASSGEAAGRAQAYNKTESIRKLANQAVIQSELVKKKANEAISKAEDAKLRYKKKAKRRADRDIANKKANPGEAYRKSSINKSGRGGNTKANKVLHKQLKQLQKNRRMHNKTMMKLLAAQRKQKTHIAHKLAGETAARAELSHKTTESAQKSERVTEMMKEASGKSSARHKKENEVIVKQVKKLKKHENEQNKKVEKLLATKIVAAKKLKKHEAEEHKKLEKLLAAKRRQSKKRGTNATATPTRIRPKWADSAASMKNVSTVAAKIALAAGGSKKVASQASFNAAFRMASKILKKTAGR